MPILDHFSASHFKGPSFIFLLTFLDLDKLNNKILPVMIDGLNVFDWYWEFDFFGVDFLRVVLHFEFADISKILLFSEDKETFMKNKSRLWLLLDDRKVENTVVLIYR